MNYLNSLTNLYKLNEGQLNYLQKKILSEDISSISDIKVKIDDLISQQLSIKGKIPETNYNKVNNFLIETYSYINSFIKQYQEEAEQERQRQRQQQISRESEQLLENIDPYELYGYSKDQRIDLNELKTKYRHYALETHPDKNNGNDDNFRIINKAYKIILEDQKMKEEDKQYTQLKNNSRDFINQQNNFNVRNTKMMSENFDIERFNNVYSDNKIKDYNDDGYGDWVKENSFDSEDIVKDESINEGNFNRIFDTNVKYRNDIVKYEKPKALFMNSDNNVQELGVDKVDNYSGKTKTIQYSDLKEAHTTTRLIDPNIKYKEYKNINELESQRSNISNFTTDELKKMDEEERLNEISERKRLERLQRYDELHANNFRKINRMMLN